MEREKHPPSSNIPYLPDYFRILFVAGSFSLFCLFNRLQPGIPCTLTPAMNPVHPKLHSIKNLKFYLYLISDNFMMVCEGSGDVHALVWNFFTSVKQEVSLAPLQLYPWERTHGTH